MVPIETNLYVGCTRVLLSTSFKYSVHMLLSVVPILLCRLEFLWLQVVVNVILYCETHTIFQCQ